MSRRKKVLFLENKITQADIAEAVELRSIIETAVQPVHPKVSFELLLLWWITHEPAEA
jgi:hypothetical protein